MNLLVAVLVALVGYAVAEDVEPGLSATTDGQHEAHDEQVWRALLACSESHSRECRGSIAAVAANNMESEANQQLASILLAEWAVERGDPRLARPQRVWAPMPTPDEARSLLPREFELVVVVVSGVVTPTGTIAEAKIDKASQHDKLNERVLAAFSRARYRPAYSKARFVSQRVYFLYRLEPRLPEGPLRNGAAPLRSSPSGRPPVSG